jgi:type 1 glutamine amidotransferase
MTRFFLSLGLLAMTALAAVAENKKLLLVTHSGGFVHASVATAETLLKEVGPKHGYDVTCWRYTGDPADPKFAKVQENFRKATKLPIEPEHCGRINKETLKKFDAVLFFTTGSGPQKGNVGPLNKEELQDLIDWVKAGGAFAGSHCASDTLYDTIYGEFIGGFFKTHPPGIQNVKLKIEDPKHPAAAGFTDGQPYADEIYIFHDEPYSRDKLHIILSCEKGSFEPKQNGRKDGDYAISWCREEGKGKVFYTSLGHQDKVWKDAAFQKHLFGGLDWATGKLPGDATPTGKGK